MKLEKISYLMPSDIHRLINNEAMVSHFLFKKNHCSIKHAVLNSLCLLKQMINQALLANRRAVAKLHLNLMEKDLQKEVLYRQRWQTNLQNWKKIKVAVAVSQFK